MLKNITVRRMGHLTTTTTTTTTATAILAMPTTAMMSMSANKSVGLLYSKLHLLVRALWNLLVSLFSFSRLWLSGSSSLTITSDSFVVLPHHHTHHHTDDISDPESEDSLTEKEQEEDTLTINSNNMKDFLVVGSVSCSSSADEHELSDKGLALEEEEEEVAPLVEPGDSGGDALEIRRDSDCSTTSSDSNVDESPEVMARIVSQVEFMFSDDHLTKDGFLLKHVRRRSDGFVSLKLVAGLRKVKQISREFSVVLKALQTSSKLEVNGEGSKVRRTEPLTTTLKTMPIKQAKKDKGDKRGGGSDKDKSFSEKENFRAGSPNNGNLTPSHSSDGDTNDEQSVTRRKRHSKFEGFNDNQYQQYQRGPQYNNNNNNKYHGKQQRPSVTSRKDENSQPLRPRGGSLPVPLSVLAPRGSVSGVYPCSTNNNSGQQRPKSNSYSEGSDPCGMSTWLQKRKASAASSRLSTGDICLNGVIRQPRGPDGTRGFVNHPRLVALAIAAV